MGTFFIFLYIFLPLFTTVISLGLTFFIGRGIEKRHYRSLEEREAKLHHIIVTNLKTVSGDTPVAHCTYVDGQAVISADYFKSFLTAIRKFFGGELKSLEHIMERARREALVRLKEQALIQGATQVCNIRLETSTIGRGQGKKGMIMAEIHAYGTAVTFH